MNAVKKTVILTAVAVTMLGAPALAQSYDPELGTGNVIANVGSQAGTTAFAQAEPSGFSMRRIRSADPRAEGIFAGAPAGVNAYAYHEGLAASQAN